MTSEEAFALLWTVLADLLGTAATAALLRRAAKRAAPRHAELSALAIQREVLGYGYTVPPSWQAATSAVSPAFVSLVECLRPLLVELTGPVAVRRLGRVPELSQWFAPPEDKHP